MTAGPASREALGRMVRETWVEWARQQPDPKPSWLIPWEDLDPGQREADMRIGEIVAAAERARIAALADEAQAVYLGYCDRKPHCAHGDHMQPFAGLIRSQASGTGARR